MTRFELNDPQLEPVTLDLDERVTLGSVKHAPPEQRDRISLGRGAMRLLDPAALDDETRVFVDGRASEFWLLSLVCGFRTVAGAPMEKAWLEVRLRTVVPDDGAPPTAWSMEPRALYDEVTVSHEVTLDTSLKLTSKVLPLDVGPSAGRKTVLEYAKKHVYVQAFREGTTQPTWIFMPSPSSEISGTHRLRTVIELPTGSTGEAEISIGASVRLKALGVIPYRTSASGLSDAQVIRFGTP